MSQEKCTGGHFEVWKVDQKQKTKRMRKPKSKAKQTLHLFLTLPKVSNTLTKLVGIFVNIYVCSKLGSVGNILAWCCTMWAREMFPSCRVEFKSFIMRIPRIFVDVLNTVLHISQKPHENRILKCFHSVTKWINKDIYLFFFFFLQ